MTEVQGPDFFIVGAPKCGTSSMHQYLAQHPQIFMPTVKDVPFFGSDLEHTIPKAATNQEEYLSWFASAPTGARVGDSATQYMQSVRAASEIAKWRPDASIIVMLRDPVDLMFSLHSHNIWMTEENILDFESALAAEPDRRRGRRRIPESCNIPATLWYRDVAALGDQLARYLEVFGRDRVHVILLDELRQDARTAVDHTLEFLGLSTDVELALEVINSRRAPRSLRIQAFLQQPPPTLERAFHAVTPSVLHERVLPFLNQFNETRRRGEQMNTDLRARLGAELRPQVDRLEELLGRDLSDWCAVPQPSRPSGRVAEA